MFGYRNDFDRTLAIMDQLRRRMDRVFDDVDRSGAPEPATGGVPPVNFHDTGNALVLQADLPGVREADLDISLEKDVLTLAGQRKSDVPEGYAAYRQERAPFRFSRSFALPVKVDPEKTSAVLQDGVLTVTLEKAPEVKPRQIAVAVR
ncbi:MAG: Hsp20/alpha crystallin family protein [Polyangiaceae bacterium]|nr:Hsp20/alpha crystallin family protein [Myxococcales bacterium]MCC6898179.1 Hsp20/alpha crystallin family protein [Polyangiaceae bacterium]